MGLCRSWYGGSRVTRLLHLRGILSIVGYKDVHGPVFCGQLQVSQFTTVERINLVQKDELELNSNMFYLLLYE